VLGNTEITTNQIAKIISNTLWISGLTDQPMSVQLHNGYKERVLLGQAAVGMKLFDPFSNSWNPILSLSVIELDTVKIMLYEDLCKETTL
jgi:hypothetical protein